MTFRNWISDLRAALGRCRDVGGGHLRLVGAARPATDALVHEQLRRAVGSGECVVIADPDGRHLSREYQAGRGDVILDPPEAWSVRWDPFAEIADREQAESLARMMVAGDDELLVPARAFVASLIWRCAERDQRDVSALWRLLAEAPVDELRALLKHTPAQSLFDGNQPWHFGTVRAAAVGALDRLRTIAAQTSDPFAISDWLDSGAGVLFLPYRRHQSVATRAMVAAWLALALARSGASSAYGGPWRHRPPARSGMRVVIDGLDWLGAIHGLADALGRERRGALRCVLAFESEARLAGIYGAADARRIGAGALNPASAGRTAGPVLSLQT